MDTNNQNNSINEQVPSNNVVTETPVQQNTTSTSNTTTTSSPNATSGMPSDPMTAAILIWIIGIIGPVLYLNDKDAYLSHQAKQALIVQIGMIVLSIVLGLIPVIGCLTVFFPIVYLVVAIMAIMKMQKKEDFVIPVVTDYAKKF